MRWPHIGKQRKEWAGKTAASKAALKEARASASKDSEFCSSSALLFDALAADLVESICRAEERRGLWHTIGGMGAAASSVAAIVTGGALTTGGLTGIGATIVGGAALFLGLAGGITAALKADVEQTQDHHKATLYEKLWWDILNYGVHHHPTAKPTERAEKLAEFVRRRAQIKDPGQPAPRAAGNAADDADK